jgi:NAD(P)-dependent dehydrogenase (short-subunit alcohol dehydrogenase family)/thioester reductase-like protein
VLVREGSQGRLAELRNRWGVDEERVVGIVGDLSQRRLGVSDADVGKLTGNVDHFFHLAAIYDMEADAESQRIANVEGTRHMIELAEAVDAGRVHMVSSIAAAGLYRGNWREDMFDEAQNLDTHPYFRTKHESERVVREECSRPWRVYRPGIVVGNSETGEMDKIDGPYYFFKLIRRIRQVVPAWMPMPGVEGREINIVPVDFVVKAMDHIAHLDGLDGRAFSLTDPDPLSAGGVIDVFARAAHAPQSSLRAPAATTEALQPLIAVALTNVPFANALTDRVLEDFGIPRSVLIYLNYPTHFDSRRTQAALAGTGIKVPPLEAYAGKLWDYWARHLDPDLYRDNTLVGAARGRVGILGGIAQIIEHQIPDEVVRFGRRLQGNASLEKEVSGNVVLVTGASSGIGKSAAMKIADAGGIVLLVARTPEKLEETRDQIADGGGIAHIHRCDLSDVDDIDRMAEEVLAQHGNVDVLINNAGRSIRRSIALSYDRFHDFERTMQLNYFGPVRLILRLLPTMRQRRAGQIINVSSIGVQTNMPRFSAYVASKSALDAFSRCIASEIIDDKVKITTIHMPLVRTPMIAPTKMYDRFPTITPDEAADMLCDAIIYKPKRIATPVGTLGQILYAINPKSIDYVLNSAYHMFPDSTAAKGGKPKDRTASERRGTGTDEQASNQQLAFAYLMRGMHW